MLLFAGPPSLPGQSARWNQPLACLANRRLMTRGSKKQGRSRFGWERGMLVA